MLTSIIDMFWSFDQNASKKWVGSMTSEVRLSAPTSSETFTQIAGIISTKSKDLVVTEKNFAPCLNPSHKSLRSTVRVPKNIQWWWFPPKPLQIGMVSPKPLNFSMVSFKFVELSHGFPSLQKNYIRSGLHNPQWEEILPGEACACKVANPWKSNTDGKGGTRGDASLLPHWQRSWKCDSWGAHHYLIGKY